MQNYGILDFSPQNPDSLIEMKSKSEFLPFLPLHSLTIGLNELDAFAWIGAFSAAVPAPEAVKAVLGSAGKTNEQWKLLWIACGKDDFLLGENKKIIDGLNEAGVDHQWLLTEGSHAWPIWRGYLADFAPLLFR